MLILTRKPGESLYIGDNIKITIVELKGHQIRVGIDAPTELRIYREEIYLQILEENKKAAEGALSSDIGLEDLRVSFPGKGLKASGKVAQVGSKSESDEKSGGDEDDEEEEKVPHPTAPSFSNFFTSKARDSGPQVVIKKKRIKKSHE